MAETFDIRKHDETPPAPGDLELVQRFMNLHEHVPHDQRDQPPPREMVRGFLVERGLLAEDDAFTAADRERAMELYRALHARVRASADHPMPASQAAVMDRVAREAALSPSFDPNGLPTLEPGARGVDAALGRLVATAFLAELDGSWDHLKECCSETCTAVFFDRSKNQSGRWCSMQSCGNRAKVRAWRARRTADDDA